MRVDLADDPAVIAMACALGMDEYCIVGRLHKLWSWADRHCDNGHAKSVTFVWIDRYVGHEGFAQSMANEGWLVNSDAGVQFPRFDRHNGKSAKTRAEAAERKRLERDVTNKTRQVSQESCDKSVTREEKRREELTTTTPNGVVAASDADDQLPAKPSRHACPHQQIIDLYHEVLPQCPQIRDWTPARATQLRARWNEDARRQDLGYWRKLFEYIGTCDFLVGRGSKDPFFADLEWITKSANFAKIREGKYENRGGAR